MLSQRSQRSRRSQRASAAHSPSAGLASPPSPCVQTWCSIQTAGCGAEGSTLAAMTQCELAGTRLAPGSWPGRSRMTGLGSHVRRYTGYEVASVARSRSHSHSTSAGVSPRTRTRPRTRPRTTRPSTGTAAATSTERPMQKTRVLAWPAHERRLPDLRSWACLPPCALPLPYGTYFWSGSPYSPAN
ncbi:hypothetical protein BS50DRAFT_220985 [Corynespora cassiicola Philippines]|uniref:Uncharacterized protein n=1 Tax=Corynespora cassiicola Philippines TaxID=1448308 RepID=A0A2T2N368_CORCC|nr:hypothetical protein BS50DRAFT_220985 [Corynespora cassiicola Philippines]